MKSEIHILCPEYVPMANKGEEAIIQGMADVIFPEGNCKFHIFDWSTDVTIEKNKIIVHPAKYYFSKWRTQEFSPGLTKEEILSSISSIIRNMLNRLFPWWVKIPHARARKLNRCLKNNLPYYDGFLNLNDIDYIIAGHNGGLDECVCHLLEVFYINGKKYSIFGSSMKPRLKRKQIISVFRKSITKSDLVITRNIFGFNWAKEHFKGVKIQLAPDPAFGMLPVSDAEVDEFLRTENLTDFFDKPVIMFTTAEPAPIAQHSFNTIKNPLQKIQAHRELLSEFLNYIVVQKEFRVLFLPHTLGKDLEIAKDIIKKSKLLDNKNVKIIEKDLSARLLKGIIKRAELLIAERVHSVIGAVGVCTPFLCLGSDFDLRVKGIISKMVECDDQIYWLNNPSTQELIKKFEDVIKRLPGIKEHLRKKNVEFNSILLKYGQEIRNKIYNQ